MKNVCRNQCPYFAIARQKSLIRTLVPSITWLRSPIRILHLSMSAKTPFRSVGQHYILSMWANPQSSADIGDCLSYSSGPVVILRLCDSFPAKDQPAEYMHRPSGSAPSLPPTMSAFSAGLHSAYIYPVHDVHNGFTLGTNSPHQIHHEHPSSC